MKSMTYGVLPNREDYDAAWDALDAKGELRSGVFHFGNDKRMGDTSLTCGELYTELKKAVTEFAGGDEDAGEWASCVLSCLGFEWI